MNKINISSSGGLHTGTTYNTSTQAIELIPVPIIPLYPNLPVGNSPESWSFVGDKRVCNNPSGADAWLAGIIHRGHSTNIAMTLRFKASGHRANTQSGWGAAFRKTDYSSGAYLDFPFGSFENVQFTLTFTPLTPIDYVHVDIFARGAACDLTVWDIEVWENNSTTLRSYGEWTSDTIDLFEEIALPAPSGGLGISSWNFNYSDITDIDGLTNLEHSIAEISKFGNFVIGSSDSDREQIVRNRLIAAGVKIWGYVQVGDVPNGATTTVTVMKETIDAHAAAGYHGIFFDNYGFDYDGSTRAIQNEVIDYAHDLGLFCVGNAWFAEDALASTVHVDNPDGIATHLGAGDWVLIESFYSRSDNKFDGEFSTFSDRLATYKQFVSLAQPLGVGVCALPYAFTAWPLNDNSNWKNAYLLAISCGINGIVLPTYLMPYTVPVGNTLTQSLTSYDAVNGMYRALTDTGVIWFQAIDTPVSRNSGGYTTSFADVPLVKKSVELGLIPTISAVRVESNLEVSGNKVDWVELHDSIVVANSSQRYLRFKTILRT
jgi:hypothetical protein